jgi:hypothetical protein
MIMTDIDEKLEAIGNWDDASVHYRYITIDDVEVSGKNAQAQGKSFSQEQYKLMSGTMTELVDTNMFDRRHQRRPQTVHMSYSDIERSSGFPFNSVIKQQSRWCKRRHSYCKQCFLPGNK